MARKRKSVSDANYSWVLLAGGAVAAVLIVRAIGTGLGQAIGTGISHPQAG